MEEVISKDNIVLERFSKDNRSHLEVAKKFDNDPVIQDFFSEWKQITALSLDDDTNTFYSYVIFDENEPIGICTITFNSDDGCVFSQGFLAEYRGKGYAKLVRNVVSEALINQGVKVIKAYIKKRNVSSIKSVSKTNGFLEEVPGTDLLEIRYTQDRKR